MYDPLFTSISGFTAGAGSAGSGAGSGADAAADAGSASASATGCHRDDGCDGERGESDGGWTS